MLQDNQLQTMLLDAMFNFASNSHRTSLKLNESQQLKKEILRNYNVQLSTFMAPIVKTLPSYIKGNQHTLEIFRDFNFLGQDKLLFTVDITSLFSVIYHSVAKHFFDQPLLSRQTMHFEIIPCTQSPSCHDIRLFI